MEQLEMMYEGKAKKVYRTDDEDLLIVDYKDDATAFNGQKKGTIVGKGVVNNRMSNYLCQLLEEKGISIFRTLQSNDSYHALDACGGLIRTGATGTNVNDLSVLLIG